MRRLFNILFAAAAALSLFACTREQLPSNQSDTEETVLVGNGPANLSLTLGTKADAKTLADAMNGDAFENVLVIITSNGKVVATKYEEYTDYPTIKVLTFEGLELGTYRIWAYANIDNTDWTTSTIAEKGLAVGDTFCSGADAYDGYCLSELNVLSGTDTPVKPSDKGMLLTGKVDFQVGVGSNSATVELLRPVVDFNVYVNNKSEYPMTLTALSFSKFNASNTYLLDDRTDEGIPTLPSGNTYRSLPAFTGTVSIAAHESDKLAYSTLLYENAASSYTLSATMGLGGGATATPISYTTLNNMAVGDTKTVLMANPTKTDGYFLGYNGGVKSEAIGEGGSTPTVLSLNNKATSLAGNADYQFKISKVEKIVTPAKTYKTTNPTSTSYKTTTSYKNPSSSEYGTCYINSSTSTFSTTLSNCVMKVEFSGYTEFPIKYYAYKSNSSAQSYIHITKLDATSYTSGASKDTDNDVVFSSSTGNSTSTKNVLDYSEYDFTGLDANKTYTFYITHSYASDKYTYRTIWSLFWFPLTANAVSKPYYTIESLNGSYGPTGTDGAATWSTTLMNYTPAAVSTSSSNLITTNNLVSLKNLTGNYLNAEGAASSLAYTSTEGDYTSWILYEIGSSEAKTASITNSQLKIIDNVTSQVTNLTYMPRNRKLNVILNAYYNESSSEFKFEVDNTYWTSGHAEAHTFK